MAHIEPRYDKVSVYDEETMGRDSNPIAFRWNPLYDRVRCLVGSLSRHPDAVGPNYQVLNDLWDKANTDLDLARDRHLRGLFKTLLIHARQYHKKMEDKE